MSFDNVIQAPDLYIVMFPRGYGSPFLYSAVNTLPELQLTHSRPTKKLLFGVIVSAGKVNVYGRYAVVVIADLAMLFVETATSVFVLRSIRSALNVPAVVFDLRYIVM